MEADLSYDPPEWTALSARLETVERRLRLTNGGLVLALVFGWAGWVLPGPVTEVRVDTIETSELRIVDLEGQQRAVFRALGPGTELQLGAVGDTWFKLSNVRDQAEIQMGSLQSSVTVRAGILEDAEMAIRSDRDHVASLRVLGTRAYLHLDSGQCEAELSANHGHGSGMRLTESDGRGTTEVSATATAERAHLVVGGNPLPGIRMSATYDEASLGVGDGPMLDAIAPADPDVPGVVRINGRRLTGN